MSELNDKIKAILRRADESRNDSEAERDTAMKMAQKLMIENGITMADLGNLDDEALPEGRKFQRDSAFVTARTESWRGSLLNAIAQVYFAEAYYYKRSHSKVWVLLGRADHVQATLTMFGWVEPQLETRFQLALDKMGLYQRLARKYALLKAGVPMHQVHLPLADTTDAELAAFGAMQFEQAKAELGADGAVRDIQATLGVSFNYAKHVRVHIRKEDIAPTVARDLAAWRETWFSYATGQIKKRLEEIQAEEAEKFGSKGTDLIVNEKGALERFKEEQGLEIKYVDNGLVHDPHAAKDGTAAGREADLRPGHRVGDQSSVGEIGA